MPQPLLEGLQWRDGTPLELWIHGDCLVVAPAASRRGVIDALDAVTHAVAPAGPEKADE